MTTPKLEKEKAMFGCTVDEMIQAMHGNETMKPDDILRMSISMLSDVQHMMMYDRGNENMEQVRQTINRVKFYIQQARPSTHQ